MGRRRNSKRKRNRNQGRSPDNNRDLDYCWNPFPNIDDDDHEQSRWDSDPGSDYHLDSDSHWDSVPPEFDNVMDDDEGALLNELVNDPSLLRRYRKY